MNIYAACPAMGSANSARGNPKDVRNAFERGIHSVRKDCPLRLPRGCVKDGRNGLYEVLLRPVWLVPKSQIPVPHRRGSLFEVGPWLLSEMAQVHWSSLRPSFVRKHGTDAFDVFVVIRGSWQASDSSSCGGKTVGSSQYIAAGLNQP